MLTEVARRQSRPAGRTTTGTLRSGTARSDRREAIGDLGVFAHGFALSKDSPAAARICKQLAAEGIGMLRFDNLGLGQSSGNWGDGSFTVKVADTVRAGEFLSDRGVPVYMLIGHSFGGAAVLAA